jgi:hypothetical protein
MKKHLVITVAIVVLYSICLFLCACDEDSAHISEHNNSLEVTDMRAYEPAEFSSVETFFSGFDEEHIQGFYYTDITGHSSSAVPGQTTVRIEGFFQIIENQWGSYVLGSEYDWREVEPSDAPCISGFSDMSDTIWLRSSVWTEEHRGKGIGGKLYISKDKNFVWFSLMS